VYQMSPERVIELLVAGGIPRENIRSMPIRKGTAISVYKEGMTVPVIVPAEIGLEGGEERLAEDVLALWREGPPNAAH